MAKGTSGGKGSAADGAAKGLRDVTPSGGTPKSAPTSAVKGTVSGALYPDFIARPDGVDVVGAPSARDDSPAANEK